MEIAIRRLCPDVPLPEYQTPGAVAFDLAVIEEGMLAPGERKMFRTGLVVKVPAGHVLLLAARSSNAKKGIQMANGIGIIDEDYCGPEDELRLFLYNIGTEPYHIQKGERIAQGFFVPITKGFFFEPPDWSAVNNRGGFGTTG
jgi:dUTP pyrophosphatase